MNNSIDKLTGLLTRDVFEKTNKHLNTYEIYVIKVGIKNMMSINDCCGHQAGDELIVTYSQYLENLVMHNNVFRVGGNEWNLIVPIEKLNSVVAELLKCNISTAIIFSDKKLLNIDKKLLEYQKQSLKRKVGSLYINEIFLLGRK